MTIETTIVELLRDDWKRTRIHDPITPSERHLERNQMVPGRLPRPRAAQEPSGFSPSVSQRVLWELESGFPIVELLRDELTMETNPNSCSNSRVNDDGNNNSRVAA
jgi:hypothetical protein